MATIASMTLEELKKLIDESVDRRLKQLFGTFEIEEEDFIQEKDPNNRTLEEVFASIDLNLWTPPVGAKSPLELLREDREG